jgi:diaminohydroxyphosphoribosylaminopyrimidine deaminase / 5-amino-6-(5-phosphoribosylamino)uracil reductase
MDCDLPDGAAWPALLAAREHLTRGARELWFVERANGWTVAANAPDVPNDARQVVFVATTAADAPHSPTTSDRPLSVWRPDTNGLPAFVHPHGRSVEAGILATLRVYVPVLLAAAAARAAGTVFVAGHVTQTLDGRIACANRAPQWFGNNADRRHAHRMRALCDGVMVGASTALGDDPQLTVRDVSGPSPRRIVLSGCGRVLHAGRPLRMFAAPGADVVIAAGSTAPPLPGTHVIPVAADNGLLAPSAVLAALAARGVHSLYLEGGTRTLSSFLRAGCLDLLQIHIAPVVLGSGLPSFDLPEVESLRAAHPFLMQHAALDGDVLLSCWPKPPA